MFLDLTMPGLSGRELYRNLRRQRPELPIVISSGYSVQDVTFEGDVDPHLRFLPKPWNERQLRETLIELTLLAK